MRFATLMTLFTVPIGLLIMIVQAAAGLGDPMVGAVIVMTGLLGCMCVMILDAMHEELRRRR
jgi:hypothetical protein